MHATPGVANSKVTAGQAEAEKVSSWAVGRKLLFLVTEDWYFCSHRLPIARAARDAGFDVVVVTRVDRHGDRILQEGFRLIALPWRRRSTNPWTELRTLVRLLGIYRRERPDIAHHVALKPAIYGSLIARLCRLTSVVNAVAGFGFMLSSNGFKARVFRRFVRTAIGSLKNSNARVMVQNPDDYEALARSGIVAERQLVMIRGSGVDVKRFAPTPEPEGIFTVAMVSRMLWSKGVREIVETTRLLRKRGLDIRTVLVGDPDAENPEAVPVSELTAWQDEGVIEWNGHVDDVPAIWAQSHVAVLPTYYREGLPKTLLEAAACGRAIVATDAPGCREIVRDGQNGYLVPVKDPEALANAIATLAKRSTLRHRMGALGRELVVDAFSEAVVRTETLAVYRSMLQGERQIG